MKIETVDKLIWAFLYGGLLSVGLGVSVGRSDDIVGWSIAGVGTVAAVIGAVLVYVRSRMKDDSRP
jgi:hypothetical protein